MQYIKKVEIYFFRSIYRVYLNDLSVFNIFTGKNDAGKSNVLKALNLFFNGVIDFETVYSFYDDFNIKRSDAVKESIKGKKFIKIAITFVRGNHFPNSLPPEFTVTKSWYLDSDARTPLITDDVERKMGNEYRSRCKSSLTQYLNKIKYYYIPAIKDTQLFQGTVDTLSNTLLNSKLMHDESLARNLEELNSRIKQASQELNSEYEMATKIQTNLALPQELRQLYGSMVVNTVYEGSNNISIYRRGDGIRVRYLPSILNYIATNSNDYIIWGFEEPENSLEYGMAEQMASDFVSTYSKNSQLFVSSHSPAFFSLEGESIRVFRCFGADGETKILPLKDAVNQPSLSEELGYFTLQKELHDEYKKKKEQYEDNLVAVAQLKKEMEQFTKPIIYTEGKTDVLILKTAWTKLYSKECPFEIKSCNLLPEDAESTAAGCDILCKLLDGTRFDSPHIVIGLFDRDEAGQKSMQKLKNYTECSIDGVQKYIHDKSYALMLPVPPGKEDFAEYSNLCIEFYFDRKYLDVKIDNLGLILEPQYFETRVKSRLVNSVPATELCMHNIAANTKTVFAEKVVPTFEVEAFENFKILFEKLLQIIELSSQPFGQ